MRYHRVMCGRFNVIDNPATRELFEYLGIDVPFRETDFARVAGPIEIVIERGGQRYLREATWWLHLEPRDGSFKPSKWTSFNTRYDKLNVKSSVGYQPFRDTRCIIVASGFGETEPVPGKKTVKRYHNFSAIDSAIAFAGLYKEYVMPGTGESVLACSIITLPPHPKLEPYHTKASPMMLPRDWMGTWLDPEFHNVDQFAPLLEPAIRHNLEGQQIDAPGKRNPAGHPFIIPDD